LGREQVEMSRDQRQFRVKRDLAVESHDGINLAVRDHGGDGPPILFMHGAGTHLLSLERLAGEMDEYRVVTMDQRWSGQSGDGDTYCWDDLVSDAECVIDGLGLGNPVVGGHSWGGMIAVHYGTRHPEVPAVVNLDGNGPGDASLYDGVDPEDFEALSSSQMAKVPAHLGAEGDSAWKDQAMIEVARTFRALGVPPEEVDAFAERSFLKLGGGRWRRHPSRPMYEGLTGDLRMFELYRRVEAPLLVVLSGGQDWGPPGAESLMAGYRRGLLRAFAELMTERQTVRLVELPESDHVGLTGRHATDTARVITTLLQEVGYAR